MIGRRTKMAVGCATTALVSASLPVVVCWLLLAIQFSSRRALPQTGSPNPANAPHSMLGPSGVLVYADSYFAGTLHLWYSVAGVMLLGLVAWSVATTVRGGPPGAASQRGCWLRLTAISIAVGFVAAAPWYYALFRTAR